MDSWEIIYSIQNVLPAPYEVGLITEDGLATSAIAGNIWKLDRKTLTLLIHSPVRSMDLFAKKFSWCPLNPSIRRLKHIVCRKCLIARIHRSFVQAPRITYWLPQTDSFIHMGDLIDGAYTDRGRYPAKVMLESIPIRNSTGDFCEFRHCALCVVRNAPHFHLVALPSVNPKFRVFRCGANQG